MGFMLHPTCLGMDVTDNGLSLRSHVPYNIRSLTSSMAHKRLCLLRSLCNCLGGFNLESGMGWGVNTDVEGLRFRWSCW